ncbi:MAG: GNAT family N-acetyltransferase [Saprospiraceae bacterium]|nr:GNAT family N-acetyltransferase [Saprospiraceae bacterium]
MIRSIEFGTPQYDEALQLRDELLRKPLSLKFKSSEIEAEYEQFHFGSYSTDGRLVGCLTLVALPEGEYKMRQVAVNTEEQNRGVGKALVDYCENWVQQNGGRKILLHAREEAVGFYEKLKYLKIGDRFNEVGIPHFKMVKSLT